MLSCTTMQTCCPALHMPIPDDGIDADDWKSWPEFKYGFDFWQQTVEEMEGREPQNLSEARILMAYEFQKNGRELRKQMSPTPSVPLSPNGVITEL